MTEDSEDEMVGDTPLDAHCGVVAFGFLYVSTGGKFCR